MKKRALLCAVVFYIAWQIWLSLAAPGKIAAELAQASSERMNILVTLPFPPERFHVLVFQRYGRVSGTVDNAIEVRGVARANLVSVARPYWVTKVEPLEGG